MCDIIHFIINPSSGGGRSLLSADYITSIMGKKNLKYKLWITKNQVDVVRFSKEAMAEGAQTIVAVGGDGTISDVAGAIMGSGIPLGIIPSGSGNDFAYSVKRKSRKFSFQSVAEDIEIILSGSLKPVDLIKMNQKIFLNIGNMGIDSEIANYADHLKKRFGRYSYLLSTVKNIFTYRPMKMKIKLDAKTVEGDYMLAAFCNGKSYGGGFKIAPMADIGDGRMTVCLVRKMPKIKLLCLFPFVLAGKHAFIKEVTFYHCEKSVLTYNGKVNLSLDGNIFKLSSPLSFTVLKGAISILT